MYLTMTLSERKTLRDLVDRVGLGQVIQELRLDSFARGDIDTEMGKKGHYNNAKLLSDLQEKLVYAWVEAETK